MNTKWPGVFLAVFFLGGAACSSSATDASDDSSICNGGKCDSFAPSPLTRLEPIIGECTVVPDTSTTDEFFLVDKVDCAFVGLDEATGAELNAVSVDTVALGTNRHSSVRFSRDELDATSKRVANWSLDGYPIEVNVRPVVAIKTTSGRLSEPQSSGTSLVLEEQIEVASRPEAPLSEVVSLPIAFDQIVVWPTQEFADKWATGEIGFLLVEVGSELEVNGTTRRFESSRHALTGDELMQLSRTVFTVPVDESSVSEVSVRISSREEPVTLRPSGPGYYLLEADGELKQATPDQVKELGMFDRDVEKPEPVPGDDSDDPVLDPTDPPLEEDPCEGACDATQACVEASCVPLADQRQISCSQPASARCETDSDCAPDNACAGGVCRLRECQTQPSSCLSPLAVCEQDSDCAEEHACAEGLCRRLACQTQATSCLSPVAVCEQRTDCAADHACVDGKCRRLACQTQARECFQAVAPCAQATDCAADHTCVDGLCRRLSCQSQSSSCFTASAVCNTDSDCDDGHICGERKTCERLTCTG